MADAHDQDGQSLVRNLIDDAVLSDPESPKPGELAFEDTPGERLRRQPVDCLDDSSSVCFRDLPERPQGALLNLDREAHVWPCPNRAPDLQDPGASPAPV